MVSYCNCLIDDLVGRTRTYCWSGAFDFEQEDLIQKKESKLGLESNNRTPTVRFIRNT